MIAIRFDKLIPVFKICENTPTPTIYAHANVAPLSIRRDALVLKSAWKALAYPLSLFHDVISTPTKSYRQLQPPTRKSARLNLAPVLVVEQRLSSRKPFQPAAQTLLANSGLSASVVLWLTISPSRRETPGSIPTSTKKIHDIYGTIWGKISCLAAVCADGWFSCMVVPEPIV